MERSKQEGLEQPAGNRAFYAGMASRQAVTGMIAAIAGAMVWGTGAFLTVFYYCGLSLLHFPAGIPWQSCKKQQAG